MVHLVPFLVLAPLLLSVADAAKHGSGRRHKRSTCSARTSRKAGTSGTASSSSYSASASASIGSVQAWQKGGKPSSSGATQTWASSASSGSAGASPTSSYASSTASAAASTSSAKSTSSSSSSSFSFQGPVVNNIAIGWLPDDGSGSGGSVQSMSTINSALGISSSAAQGYYAQAQSGVTFTGSQLTDKMDEIKAAGGVFQPAVMPTGGWQGLTSSDNSQAVNICNVMKQFTDAGLEVWLRFAHEVNWYQSDGTYTGNADDFKEGWATVAAACKSIAPDVKMWFTPNVASLSVYQEYFPDDVSTVDLIGVDYYPAAGSSSSDFLNVMQSFHDTYCSDTLHFAIGETGLNAAASISDRLAWAQAITSSSVSSAMPYIRAMSWFNYYKGYDFAIAGTSGDSITKAWIASASSSS